MLCELFVQNLALIEDVRVELRPGFCAWTGQTGAGKTLLLEALGLLLGERGSVEMLRAGQDDLRITGRFEVTRPDLKAEVQRLLEMDLPEGEILLTRRLTRAGRSFAYVNDQPVAVATLKNLGALLVDIHGQRESHSLLQPAFQLQLLDSYGGLDALRQDYLALAEQVRDLRRRHAALTGQRQQRQRELALLRFEREELDTAALRPGELLELTRKRERLVHAQSLQTFAGTAYGRLYDDEESMVEQLGKLQREALSWSEHDPQLTEVAQRLEALVTEIQDLSQTLHTLETHWEADPALLDEIEKRLQTLRRLETKYGRSCDDLIAYRATLDDQERALQQQEDDLTAVVAAMGSAYGSLREVAHELSRQRQRVAKRLTAEAQKHLAELGMSEARLEADLQPLPLSDDPLTAEIPSWGADQLELTLAANRGEPAWPLRKVASGGEFSRTMLALKTVLAAHDHRVTLIFDEIDANVGGRLGDVLGQKLAALGQTRQVICVTHLPQVASFAAHHWSIGKTRPRWPYYYHRQTT